jgi:hypothetical protein
MFEVKRLNLASDMFDIKVSPASRAQDSLGAFPGAHAPGFMLPSAPRTLYSNHL